ncbi:thioredoxin [Hydrogenispora ethanolica]
MTEMLNLTEQTFTAEVIRSDKTVLVDFWAPWCGPCRMVAPVLEDLAQEFDGRLKIVKVNVDENPNLAAEYGIMSIPTLLIFKDGRKVDSMVGAYPKPTITSKLQPWLA